MPLPVALSVVSVAGFAIILVILVQPLIFSDVHVAGREGADVIVVFPEIFTLVTLVPTSAKVVSPVGKVGSVTSDVQPDKFKLKVPVGSPPIVVIPAPTIVNAVGKPEHPVRFSDVHVAGSVGTDVIVVFPEIFTLVTLVPTSAKLISPVGKVGSVVSDVQPDKFRLKVPVGNPPILVIPAPTIVNAVGNPEHPVRFSVVHVAGSIGILLKFLHPARFSDVSAAGRAGKDDNAEQSVRFSDVHVVGRLETSTSLVSPVRSTVISLVQLSKNRALTAGKPVIEVIFGGGIKLITLDGILGRVVSLGHPVRLRYVTDAGIPLILVIPAPAIVNGFLGKPVHPVRFSVVSAAGRVGKDDNAEQSVRFSDVHVVGRASIKFKFVSPVRLIVVSSVR